MAATEPFQTLVTGPFDESEVPSPRICNLVPAAGSEKLQDYVGIRR